MDWIIPGTVLTGRREDADWLRQQFSSMFMAGGIVLSQVSGITGLEPYTIQNWVKRGFLSPPRQKRYSLGQLCRVLSINMLKSVLPMERICGLLTYVNGQLDDESDDLIDDADLYFTFVRLAARVSLLDDPQAMEQAMEDILRDYREPSPGARDRVANVLRIMLTAYASAHLRQQAENMLAALEQPS